MTDGDSELHLAQAKQLNNSVWDVLDAGELAGDSPEAREALLYAAYASAHHWRQVGTAVNQLRAEHLISRAAALAGYGDAALHHARRCLELCDANRDDIADWDLGFAHEALARALAATGDPTAAEARAHAITVAAAIADEQDREIVEGELARAPWFGLA